MTKLQPVWDQEKRELRLGDVVVKLFRWPAANQECLLQAFEEQGWPSRIDDPLPRSAVNPKARLHDTIKCLNKNQQNKLIKFRGDGTGEGVLFELRLPEQEVDVADLPGNVAIQEPPQNSESSVEPLTNSGPSIEPPSIEPPRFRVRPADPKPEPPTAH